jgi:hypothetical protein
VSPNLTAQLNGCAQTVLSQAVWRENLSGYTISKPSSLQRFLHLPGSTIAAVHSLPFPSIPAAQLWFRQEGIISFLLEIHAPSSNSVI